MLDTLRLAFEVTRWPSRKARMAFLLLLPVTGPLYIAGALLAFACLLVLGGIACLAGIAINIWLAFWYGADKSCYVDRDERSKLWENHYE